MAAYANGYFSWTFPKTIKAHRQRVKCRAWRRTCCLRQSGNLSEGFSTSLMKLQPQLRGRGDSLTSLDELSALLTGLNN